MTSRPARPLSPHAILVALALALAAFGCSARAPSEAAAAAPSSTGGETGATEESSDRDGTSAGYGGGLTGEADPSAAPEDAESLDAADAFDVLRSVETDYDALMDRGSADCPQAEHLVQRICYLAERVCGLEGVDAELDPNGPDDAARCDEARARCAASQMRLQRACDATR